jgi:hypothetical protein
MPMAIANNARLEAAAETLAEYIGFLHAQICVEEDQPAPDQAGIAALEAHRQEVVHERKAFTPAIADKALYVYAPALKALRTALL